MEKKKFLILGALLIITAACISSSKTNNEKEPYLAPDAIGLERCPSQSEACKDFETELSYEDPKYFEELSNHYKKRKGSRVILEFSFGPRTETCYGPFEQQCLIQENGDYFYDSIGGFEFEEGHGYKIEVIRTQTYDLQDAPQDAGLYEYELLKVLEKTKK